MNQYMLDAQGVRACVALDGSCGAVQGPPRCRMALRYLVSATFDLKGQYLIWFWC